MRKSFLKKCRRVVASTMCALLVAGLVPASAMADTTETTVTIESAQQPFRVLSVDEMVAEMGNGYNLGNTFDGHTAFSPNETLWQPTVTNQKYIDAIHDMGFNTLRVPVTWGTMINDEDYSINEAWISRIQDVVDYAISQDMYVILNIHHDGAEQTGWLRLASDDIESVYTKFEGVWKTISERFKDYDEHLIFESMNEVTDNSALEITECYNRINKLNQIFVDTVRSTGSNNAERWLSIPGRYTNIDNMTKESNGFKLPEDSVKDRLFVAVHQYTGGMGLTASMSSTECTEKTAEDLAGLFQKCYDTWTSKGIPVILGEYGTMNKNNDVDRAYEHEIYTTVCKAAGIVPVYWDNGAYDLDEEPADFCYTLVDREDGHIIYPTIITAMLRGHYIDRGVDSDNLVDYVKKIVKDAKVNEITSIKLSEEKLELTIGDVKSVEYSVEPADSNDVVTWSTSDRSVATVYQGKIIARGIGKATITAVSDSGSQTASLTVVVKADSSITPATGIKLSAESLELAKSEYAYLNGVAEGSDDAYVVYKSSNPAVATVSRIGKVVAVSDGTAYITATASTGVTKTIKVVVSTKAGELKMNLALCIYAMMGKTINEVGQPVEVTGEGEYTVVYDCATDLSDAAKDAGIDGIKAVGAIYIKDYDVLMGNTPQSPVSACNVLFTKVVVDGQELTITQTEPKNAMKGTALDTGDPVNGWDGSSVEEVSANGTQVSFTTSENPQRVEVTFKLSDIVMEGAESEEGGSSETVEAESLELSGEAPSKLEVGAEAECTLKLTPAEAGIVSVVSSDASVAYVDVTGITADSDGTVKFNITGMGDGTATITAMTENGKEVTFDITVGYGEKVSENDKNDNNTKGDKEVEKGFPQWAIIAIVAVVVVVIVVIIVVSVSKKKKAKI